MKILHDLNDDIKNAIKCISNGAYRQLVSVRLNLMSNVCVSVMMYCLDACIQYFSVSIDWMEKERENERTNGRK